MRLPPTCIAAMLALAPVALSAQSGDAALLTRFCGDTLRKPEMGALVGRVRSADDGTPLAGVSVLVRWNEVGVDKSSGSVSIVPRTLVSVSDGQALYRFCALPRYTPLVVQSQAGDRNSGIVDLRIGDEPVLVHGFSLSLRAQNDSEPRGTAAILGDVVAANGEHVRDARVNLDGLSRWVVSNDTGIFMLPRLPAGSQTVIVRSIGYLPKRVAVELRDGVTSTLTVVLDRTVRVLDSVRIIGKRYSSQEDFLVEFEKRKRASPGGLFFTEEYLRQRVYGDTRDIFRNIAGLTVSPDGVVSLTRGAASMANSRCIPALFIDDIRMETTLDVVRPHEIRGLEIYRGPATAPPMYNDPCGAIVIWTK